MDNIDIEIQLKSKAFDALIKHLQDRPPLGVFS